jgi:predicted ATPase/class 3 adenylate cyclase
MLEQPNAATTTRALPTGTVAFLFTDIEGSTQRWETHRAAMAEAIERHDTVLQKTIAAHEGYVFKRMGDAVCAAFRTAPDAISAAFDAQRALIKEDFSAVDGLKVRMAVHVGHADEHGGDYFGPSVNRVSRLLAIGYGGQVLVSGAAADLSQGEMPAQTTLRDLGSHRLKDLAQPEQVYQLVASDLPQKFFPLRSLDALPNNLPVQLTQLIGREHDVAEVQHLLDKTRLLMLVGAGGIGKTRLAVQAGAESLERYPDGVWFVDLASTSDPNLVAETIARVFEVTQQPGRSLAEAISGALRSKTALLILDNCEHVITAAAALAETLLRGCTHLRILATSREPLDISGETVHRVPSLAFPEASSTLRTDEALTYGAIALFVERAMAANTRFTLTNAHAHVVAGICKRLDGIPLAIELAAARAKALSVDQLAAMLDERFRLLTGGSRTALPRQQTLRAMLDWSYDLISENERTVFRRLSVFAGGFSLEGAQRVCSDAEIADWDVIDLVASLVEKSLVVAELADAGQRYRLLETTRAYASERFAEQPEAERVREEHAGWFLQFAEQVANKSTLWRDSLASLALEIDNFRSALDWWLSGSGNAPDAARLIALIAETLREAGSSSELWRWCETAVNALGKDPPAKLVAPLLVWMAIVSSSLGYGRERRAALISRGLELARAADDALTSGRALEALAFHLILEDRHEDALAAVREALDFAQATSDRRLRAQCLDRTAMATFPRNAVEGRRLFDEAAALFEAAGDAHGRSRTFLNRAESEFAAGDAHAATAFAEECMRISREIKNRDRLAISLANASAYYASLGELDRARSCARESLALARDIQDSFDIPFSVQHLATVAQAKGDSRTAACLLGWCDARLVAMDERRQKTEMLEYRRLIAALQAQHTEDQLSALFAQGAAMTEESAIEEAFCV